MEDKETVNSSDDRTSTLIYSDRVSRALFTESQKDLLKNEAKEHQTNDEKPCDHLIATYWG